jgi:putative protease
MEDENGIKIKYDYRCDKNPAKNMTQAEETIRQQFTKLGNSIFICTNLIITWSQPYFLPVRVCNEIRREGIRLLEEERIKQFKRHLVLLQPNTEPYPEMQLTYSANVANRKAKAFYLRHVVRTIENAFELQHKSTGKTVMTMKHCLRFQYDLCPGKNKINAEPLFMHDSRNKYRLEFDCEACQMKIVVE